MNYVFSAIDDFDGEHAASEVEDLLVGDFGFAFEGVGFFAWLWNVRQVFPQLFAHLDFDLVNIISELPLKIKPYSQ